MPFVNVYISREDVLDAMSVDEVVKHLVGRDGWRDALLKHWDNGPLIDLEDAIGDIRALIEAHRMGRDTRDLLRTLADRHFGMVL